MTEETQEQSTTETTVTTLTAAVRVLMVGKRQVTLSVFRQLDEVDIERIEPFGRVRDNGKQHLVGVDVETGNLVRANLMRANAIPSRPIINSCDIPDGSVRGCVRVIHRTPQEPMALNFGGWTVSVDRYIMRRLEGCKCEWFRHDEPCTDKIWVDDGVSEVAQDIAAKHEWLKSLHARGLSMGLIVLAGLK